MVQNFHKSDWTLNIRFMGKSFYQVDPKKPGMHPIYMIKKFLGPLSAILLACGFLAATLPAQREQTDEESAYGEKFFDQLRTIFGRFRDTDLQRAFQEAQPIQCPELVGRKGEWRPVAFFNEDRKLGDWCRESLEQVKSDLEIYTFRGSCSGDQGTVEVTTEFPTTESIEDYGRGEIDLGHVDITVNDPVRVSLNRQTMAYTFVLPYLFLTGKRGSMRTYSFSAPNRDSAYTTDVSARWECKLVFSKDVTYRFLICRTATIPRGSAGPNRKYEPSFGSSAFYILSDGMEARTSAKMLSAGEPDSGEKEAESPPADGSPARPSLTRKGKANPSGK